MSNKDMVEGKGKSIEGAIKDNPEDLITDDLNAKPVEGQVQEKAGETPLKAGEAGKVTG